MPRASADKYGNIQYNKPYWTIEKDGSMVLRDPYGNRIPRKDGKVMTDNQGIRNAGEWNASAESALVRNGSTSCELLELERC